MTSFINRTDGLVQRRNVTQQSTTIVGEDDRGDEKIRDEEEEEDHDSKETRLTLMEEVLLLGLKDREVCMPLDPMTRATTYLVKCRI